MANTIFPPLLEHTDWISIRFNDNGKYLIVGMPGYGNPGGAFVYKITSATNKLYGADGQVEISKSHADYILEPVGGPLQGTSIAEFQAQGCNVALSPEGDYAAVYDSGDQGNPNAPVVVYVFRKKNDSYVQTDIIYTNTVGVFYDAVSYNVFGLPGAGGLSFFKGSKYLAIGCPTANGQFNPNLGGPNPFLGGVQIYERSNNKWKLVQSISNPNVSQSDSHQGCSLSVTPDGSKLLFGGPAENISIGGLFLYQRK